MKKMIIILLIFLTACSNKNIETNKQNNIELNQDKIEIYQKIDYTLDDVIEKGYYVILYNNIYNSELLDQFISHQINKITIVNYTEEGDMIIDYIEYIDGNYHIIRDTTRDRYGYIGYLESELTEMEITDSRIILKNPIPILGEREDTIYNIIEETNIIRESYFKLIEITYIN